MIAAIIDSRMYQLRIATLLLCSTVWVSCSSKDAPTQPSGSTLPVAHDGLRASTPSAEGVAQAALDSLVADAAAQQSDALIVLRNGKIVYESYFGKDDTPILAQSASKSFVSLAYGFMLHDRTLLSLDDPVVKYDPDFAYVDARKATITIRHLLSQTSGLGPWRASVAGGGNDILAYANRSPLVFTPGSAWQYSNNGVDLLSALTLKIAGKSLDAYLNEKLFGPLGSPSTTWKLDTAGTPYGAGELHIRAIDMAKVGQLIADRGMWNGKQIVDPAWIDEEEAISSSYNGDYGLLWWRNAPITSYALTAGLLDQWEGNGLARTVTDKLRPTIGASFGTYNDYLLFLQSRLAQSDLNAIDKMILTGDHVPFYRLAGVGAPLGYYFNGALGQWMYAVPSKNLVVVRMRRATGADATSTTELNGFPTFLSDVDRLVP